MALEHHAPLMSYEDFLKLPPESPGELIDGILIVPPSPQFNHQVIADTLYFHIRGYLEAHPEIGIACTAPMDVVLRAERPAIVVQPDILFVSAAREGIIEAVVKGAPDLVVEVVSPSTAHADAVRKRELYARFGVREYWLVWPSDETIDVLTGENGLYSETRSFATNDALTSPLLPGFELPIARVFAKRPSRGN